MAAAKQETEYTLDVTKHKAGNDNHTMITITFKDGTTVELRHTYNPELSLRHQHHLTCNIHVVHPFLLVDVEYDRVMIDESTWRMYGDADGQPTLDVFLGKKLGTALRTHGIPTKPAAGEFSAAIVL